MHPKKPVSGYDPRVYRAFRDEHPGYFVSYQRVRYMSAAPSETAEAIKARRKAEGVLQRELAARCGISQSTLSHIEHGSYETKNEILLAYAGGEDIWQT